MVSNVDVHGEPYIIHPLNVAYILADIGLDDSTICAALLHDIVEDTEITDADIRKEFGMIGTPIRIIIRERKEKE